MAYPVVREISLLVEVEGRVCAPCTISMIAISRCVGDAPATFLMAWQSLMVSRRGGKLFSRVKKCLSRDEFGDVWIARASSGMEFRDGGFIW
jgi:hypothetical protein